VSTDDLKTAVCGRIYYSFSTRQGSNPMEQMSTFEMILLGAIALGVLFWIGPGIKGALQQSREAENKDWAGVLLPIIIVVIFVFFLIKMV
jgi:hypothetical protein